MADQPAKLPIDALAQMNHEQSVTILGLLPVVAVVVVAIVGIALYVFRRGRNWNELGEEMRYDPATDKAAGDKSGLSRLTSSSLSSSTQGSMHDSEPEQRFKKRGA